MKPIIVIDPGHGGHDSGAVGPNRVREKDVALAVGLLLAEQLQDVCKVVMTRSTDVFLELPRRAEIANGLKPDLFLSIHCNSATNPARGFEVWTSKGQTLSDTAATDLFLAFGVEFRELGQRKDLSDGDVDKEANFAVLRLTDCPAVLFELEFIHVKEGEAWLSNKAVQARMAQALANGVADFLDIELGGESWDVVKPPPPVPAIETAVDPDWRKIADLLGKAAAIADEKLNHAPKA
jgi:N-acetylmuramoyl-L-alanine amidase